MLITILRRISIKIYDVLFILGVIILLLDTVGSSNTVYKYIGFSSHNIVVVLVCLLIILRFRFNKKMSHFSHGITKFFFPFVLSLSITLILLDYFTYPNFVFSLFRLQYVSIYFIALFIGSILMLQQSSFWYRENYKKIVVFGAPLAFLYVSIMELFPFDKLIYLSQEDEFFEMLQYVFLILALIYSYKLTKFFFSNKDKLQGFSFTMVFMVIILLIGEEVSWGQRIFNIQTPQFIVENNAQQEISIHNLYLFDRNIDIAYLMVCIYGTFTWLISKHLKNKIAKKITKYYLVPVFIAPYFLIGLIFYLYNTFDQRFGYWDEFMELMVYSGVALTLLNLFLRIYKKHTND